MKRFFFLFLFFFITTNVFAFAQKDKLIFDENIVIKARIKKSFFNIKSDIKNIHFRKISEKFPAKYDDFLKCLTPQNNLITNKAEIMVKGENKYLLPTYINGKAISVREDGRFFYKVPVQKGANNLILSFCTPTFDVISINKKVIYLVPPPKDINLYDAKNRIFMIYYLNSELMHPSRNVTHLTQSFTRADLAYFLFQINKQKDFKVKTPIFIDVPINFWASSAIQYAVEKNMMLEYPDGRFYPEKSVDVFEYVITMIRALNLQQAEVKNVKIPYLDIDQKHWTTRYLKIALKNNLLPKKNKLNALKELNYGDFISLAIRLPKTKEIILQTIDFNRICLDTVELHNYYAQIRKRLTDFQITNFEKSRIEFSDPKNKKLYLDPIVYFKGRIYPPMNFEINKEKIKPNIKGDFLISFNIKNKINHFNIKVFKDKYQIETYYLVGYKDLKTHWLSETAAKLRDLQLLDKNDYFYPNKEIRKYELAKYLLTFFDLKSLNKRKIEFLDLTYKNEDYPALKVLNELEILKTNKKGQIEPYKITTRLEAVVAIIRALNLKVDERSLVKLPFRDISHNHWAYKDLQIALSQGIISGAKNFNANQKITKAELVALLAKTPIIKDKLANIFTDVKK